MKEITMQKDHASCNCTDKKYTKGKTGHTKKINSWPGLMKQMNRFSFQGCETVLKHAGMTADQLDLNYELKRT